MVFWQFGGLILLCPVLGVTVTIVSIMKRWKDMKSYSRSKMLRYIIITINGEYGAFFQSGASVGISELERIKSNQESLLERVKVS